MESGSREGKGSPTGSCLSIFWCFRVVIAVQCAGLAGRYLFASNESESDVFGFLFFDRGWPEGLAQLIDDVGSYGCLVSMVALVTSGLFWPRSSGPQAHRGIGFVALYVENAALILIATWFFLLAAAHSARGETNAEFAIAEHAVRFTTPLAMLLLLRKFATSGINFAKVATLLLTAAAASTFIAHGYVAQLSPPHGPFVDLILLSDLRLFQFGLEQSTAETLLKIIGWADIVVGALLLLTRWRMMAVYMIIWGLITAASRMTAFGVSAWPETFIRAANGGAPLVLLLLYTNIMHSKDPIRVGDSSDES